VILVPFGGSGSECVAAKAAGRHFIGFELNPDYIAIAESRLSATKFGSGIQEKELFALQSEAVDEV
jgi:site-specific DNA-methyltransferase (adenine-specific)/adenine-specific DNA-methyltransferase